MQESDLIIKLPKIRVKNTYWHLLWFIFGSKLKNKNCVKIYVDDEMIKAFTFNDLKNEKESTDNMWVIDDKSPVLTEFLDSCLFKDKILKFN